MKSGWMKDATAKRLKSILHLTHSSKRILFFSERFRVELQIFMAATVGVNRSFPAI